MQGLIDLGGLQQGHKVLINGAGGGVGTFAIQLAKLCDAEVTGVDNTAKQDFLQSLGFDHSLDYTAVDFTKRGEMYDLILDTKTNRSPFSYARALKPGGSYVTVGGSIPRIIACLLLAPWIRRMHKRSIRVLALKPNKGLPYLLELFEAGKLMPSMDKPFQLPELKEAFQRFSAAEHLGKLVISVAGAGVRNSN